MRRAWGVLLIALVLAGCRGAVAPTPSPEPTFTVAVPTRLPATATPTVAPATLTPTLAYTHTPTPLAGHTPTPPSPQTPTLPPSPTPDPAVDVIRRYLEARAAADVELTTALSCPAWKSQAVTEAISFRSMNAQLQEVSCETTGAADGYNLVVCQGTMLTTYGPDTREWDLSNQVYRAAPEAGEWKMCGYQ
jgi:hypothetical protein